MSRDKSWAQTEKFRELLGLVGEIWFGLTTVTPEEFEHRVNDAYAEG